MPATPAPAPSRRPADVELLDCTGERVLTISSGRSRARQELPSWRTLLADSLPPESSAPLTTGV